MSTDADIGRNPRTALDDRERADAGTGIHLRIFCYHGAGMNSRHSLGLGIEQMGNACIGQVRISDDQCVAGKAFSIRSL
ncbi:hypothetical protein D3C77_734140 [compost metagenome]